MIYKAYSVLRDEALREADMEAEEFVQVQEVIDYFNDAVREACAHIQKLGLEDDYFQKSVSYNLTPGLTELDLPVDMYAAKIRGLIYATSSKVYPITRLKGPNKFELIQRLLINPPATDGGPYYYDLENSSPITGFKIKLYPISTENTVNSVILNYVRTVGVIALDADLVDIPEFYSFIKAFVKYKLFDKENSEKSVSTKADYEKEKLLMMETLSEMTPDYDNKVIGDYSTYEEHS